jgi:hypothetical protein
MSVEQHKTYIGCVRAATDARDRDAFAARLRAAIAALDLRPQGLHAQAVVCLRCLPAPWPEYVLTGGTADPRRLRAWEAATVRALQTAIASAVRPAHEFVPAGAECVVFEDRAEMLACLASDWCDAGAHARWWWRSLFRRRDLFDAPVGIWLLTPEYVPAALARLASRDRLAPFARALNEAEARRLLDGLVACFDLRELAAVFVKIEHAAGSDTSTPHARAAPWFDDVPESRAVGLTPTKQCLIGVGLMLQRAPARLRTGGFAKSVRIWLEANAGHEHPTLKPFAEQPMPPALSRSTGGEAAVVAHDSSLMREETHTRLLSRTETVESAGQNSSQISPDDLREDGFTTSAVDERGQQDDADTHHAKVGASPVANAAETPRRAYEPAADDQLLPDEFTSSSDGELHTSARTSEDAEHFEDEFELTGLAGLPTDSVERAPLSTEPAAFEPETRIETGFGGLFFLINLAIFLELYGDFTAPLAPGLPLAAWDFVAMLGERLLGGEVRCDAVWSLLAQLAGRDAGAEPGEGFEPEDEWRIPCDWLKPLSRGGAWRWTTALGRLQVAHPAGFPVLDLPRDERAPEQQLAGEMRPYADQHSFELVRVGRGLVVRGRTPLARWLARLSAYVRVRLCLAFGRRRAREAVRLLCALPGRVVATATHVDVFISLNDLPIEVRLAGLDRDPGWVPAAGRFIAFHFE